MAMTVLLLLELSVQTPGYHLDLSANVAGKQTQSMMAKIYTQ